MLIRSSRNVDIFNSKIFGEAKNFDSFSCNKDGDDGLKIINTDSVKISNCEVPGGKGGDGYSMGVSPAMGGYGGHSLNLTGSSKVEIINSHFIGGTGGKTASSLVPYFRQAKAGDGAYCVNSDALFLNSILEGGVALINNPPFNIPFNTVGGNGITAVNNTRVNIDGGTLIRGLSSDDANGRLYYTDSTSLITFTNLVINISITKFNCIFEKNSIKFTWIAEVGINFKQFEIEKISDEYIWNTIAIITNNTDNQSFSYLDTTFTISPQILKYRIKVLDMDSNFTYSEEKGVALYSHVTDFDCILKNKFIELKWKVDFGQAFLKFEIDRLIDNESWYKIADVYKGDQIDDSFLFIESSFSRQSKNLKYRIKVVNTNSSFSYSDEKEISLLPTIYKLDQNYLNPFNSITTIEYSIPEQTDATLKVFDLLGSEITTLVNDRKAPGNYKAEFIATSLPSGIYFYRRETRRYNKSKKLIVFK